MRALPHPRTGEGAAVPGLLTLIVLETTALVTAPARDRPIVGGRSSAQPPPRSSW
ncbi:hypothetical protein [Streptomyces sp. JNUCC 63]